MTVKRRSEHFSPAFAIDPHFFPGIRDGFYLISLLNIPGEADAADAATMASSSSSSSSSTSLRLRRGWRGRLLTAASALGLYLFVAAFFAVGRVQMQKGSQQGLIEGGGASSGSGGGGRQRRVELGRQLRGNYQVQ